MAGGAASTSVETPSIDGFMLTMQLFGGLAIFLFGIDQMSDGLKAVAGRGLAKLLGTMTRNRFVGALTGAFVTAVLNSSSVTTVLVVGFITAGIMTLSQSIGVIMGANIGSTMTAQIVAFNVTKYALLPVAIGFGMMFMGKSDKVKYSGSMLFGLGLLFGGMGVMSDAMYPLRTYEPFLDLMAKMANPLLGVLVGAVFTALVQSSAATTGIAIVMASEGLMTLPAGIALALGANIGTCATAVLASIGKPVAARRATAAHILFNVLGVIIWLPFLDQLAGLATSLSPVHPELAGSERLAAEVPRQIANAHTPVQYRQYRALHLVHRWFGHPGDASRAGPPAEGQGDRPNKVPGRRPAGHAHPRPRGGATRARAPRRARHRDGPAATAGAREPRPGSARRAGAKGRPGGHAAREDHRVSDPSAQRGPHGRRDQLAS